LSTLGVQTNIRLNHKAGKRLLPKNDGSGDYDYYMCKDCYLLFITVKSVNKLIDIGFSPKRLKIVYCERLNNTMDVLSPPIVTDLYLSNGKRDKAVTVQILLHFMR
jgi:hypothetical protein